ncbi:uncharacterized protein LOC110608200 isoform X2 [Manihot esculenta]|uniref:Uncharacterized protein n=2 Tax=Manihot esculenta TaxID=3983 RepID=A0ACB7I9Q8_MANES|nr:uncharacterized protein LOC110608200 isoform X2 [Manihot esculenta]KAG8661633.1 hypothetical protein MANES_01G026850v8 [Manihot esculenta]
MGGGRVLHHLLLHASRRSLFSPSFRTTGRLHSFFTHNFKTLQFQKPRYHSSSNLLSFSLKRPISAVYHYPNRFLNTDSSKSSNYQENGTEENALRYETTEEGKTEEWEEEEEVEPQAGDGGDGGGVVLQGVPWGERALSIAREVLLQFGDEMELYAFKTTPRGYVYVRLDKLSNEYGCPTMEELESYSQEYMKRLEEVGALGEIPDDLALEVSSPGAERILKVPDDLCRFKEMPMRVYYTENAEPGPEKDGIFFLESIEKESENCVWKLADVKENRDPESKGRPLSRKMRDWRLKLPFKMHRRITLYLEF